MWLISKGGSSGHTHDNKSTLDKLTESNDSLNFNGSPLVGGEGHTHSNKTTLDKFGESNGSPTFNGSAIGGTTTNNVTLSVYQSDITAAPFNYYNALDNGLVNDGTTDNKVALQNLVNAVNAAGGGTIYVPKGTYLITGSVYWKSNVSMVGDGKDLTIFKGSGSSAYAIFYQLSEEVRNVVFQNFTVDGYNVVTPSYHVSSKAFFFQKVVNSIWRDLRLMGTGATALGIDFLHDVHIDNVTTIDCGRQWAVDGTDAGGAGIGIGTGWYPIENLTITNCKTYNSGQFGIFVEHQGMFNQGTEKAKGVTIDNCIVVGGRNHGIGIKGGHNVTLSSCQTYENAKNGIYILGVTTEDKADLKKIKVVNNTSSENGKDGIYVASNSRINGLTINDNILANNSRHGITLFETATSVPANNITIKNNLISDNLGTDLFIANQTTLTNLRISGNESSGNAKNSGKLNFGAKSYAEFPVQLLEHDYNEITLKFKTGDNSADSCLLSRRDTNFSTTTKPLGFSVILNGSEKIQITGCKTNDGTLYTYTYNEIFTVGEKHYLKIDYKSGYLAVQRSTDGITYTPLTLDTANSTGLDSDIISVLGSAKYHKTYLGIQWAGSSGWNKRTGTLVFYLFKVKTNSVTPATEYEYRFNNVGYNKEIMEINGTNLNGISAMEAQQMANEIE